MQRQAPKSRQRQTTASDERNPKSLDPARPYRVRYPPMPHDPSQDAAQEIELIQKLDPERAQAAKRQYLCPWCFDPRCIFSRSS